MCLPGLLVSFHSLCMRGLLSVPAAHVPVWAPRALPLPVHAWAPLCPCSSRASLGSSFPSSPCAYIGSSCPSSPRAGLCSSCPSSPCVCLGSSTPSSPCACLGSSCLSSPCAVHTRAPLCPCSLRACLGPSPPSTPCACLGAFPPCPCAGLDSSPSVQRMRLPAWARALAAPARGVEGGAWREGGGRLRRARLCAKRCRARALLGSEARLHLLSRLDPSSHAWREGGSSF